MSLKINNDTANGSATLQASNTATGDVVATLPPFSTELAPRMQLMTAKTASGTSVDFTGIPSWAKKITVMFNGVSTNGTSLVQVQLGDSGGIGTTGYISAGGITSGFAVAGSVSAGDIRSGSAILTTLGGNVWSSTGGCVVNGTTFGALCGSKTLPSTLDRIRITTVNGTDLFDAGTINILVEG